MSMRQHTQQGLSLIELLVALTIGSVLIFGATQVYVDSRNAYGANESVARLQETARYAMSIIETDVRSANYFGLARNIIGGVALQNAAVAAVAPGAPANICGNNFAVDFANFVQGDNTGYVLSPTRQAGCDTLSGWNTTPVATADTLTIRRASTVNQLAFTNGRLQLCSDRGVNSLLFSNAGICVPAPVGQINDIIVNAYYVDRNSAQAVGLPSLRRKALAVGPAFIDEEVIAGVEDMQVQFGVETINNAVGAIGQPQNYIDPAALAANQQVVAVRVWLLIRSDTPDVGFSDDRQYAYGGRNCANGVTADLNNAGNATQCYQPSVSADNTINGVKRFRRILVTRTFYLRDAYGT
jgi:type IV pilus assembly protein PilW